MARGETPVAARGAEANPERAERRHRLVSYLVGSFHPRAILRQADLQERHLVAQGVAVDAEGARRADQVARGELDGSQMYFFSNSFRARSRLIPCVKSSSMTC